VQERQHDIGKDGARGVVGEEAVEGGMRSCVVELLGTRRTSSSE
jgi:hypothetical protein